MEGNQSNQQKNTALIFEQYKIATEMADRISARREGANRIFLSANSIILAFIATKNGFLGIDIVICIFGVILSVIWASIIQNYRSLNSAKYAVILEMEKHLPWEVYGDEWKKLKEGTDKKVYAKLTKVEKKIPHIFLIFYIVLFLYICYSFFGSNLLSLICAK